MFVKDIAKKKKIKDIRLDAENIKSVVKPVL